SYSANAQMWLDHGFAFVSVNYRACSTCGQEFKDEIIGDLGHWEVDDMVAATQWLVQQGIAQSDRILLLGWSYGGYLSLMGLGTQPMLWAGAMTSVAIVDWLGMYEDIVEAFKPLIVHYLGGTPEELPEQYARSSPITYVEQVQAPVLIIQGMNDGRLPSRSIKLYEEKMKAHGKSIEVDWFDAGHMGVGIEQEIEHAERMLRFAYRVLNG
ncbi:MAG: prolyl oligopeptidase family serine peptidase, partial [Chloroflexi bacterium]|nr:prolyl oligopeptidase family serine peptidase [Chloroflexota bacterium]